MGRGRSACLRHIRQRGSPLFFFWRRGRDSSSNPNQYRSRKDTASHIHSLEGGRGGCDRRRQKAHLAVRATTPASSTVGRASHPAESCMRLVSPRLPPIIFSPNSRARCLPMFLSANEIRLVQQSVDPHPHPRPPSRSRCLCHGGAEERERFFLSGPPGTAPTSRDMGSWRCSGLMPLSQATSYSARHVRKGLSALPACILPTRSGMQSSTVRRPSTADRLLSATAQ